MTTPARQTTAAHQTTASTPAHGTTSTVATRGPAQRKPATATGRAHVLPPGCNLDIESQTVGALAGHDDAFHFDGYNAVPPGHPVSDVLISWGDGTTSPGSATTHPKPFAAGCFETVFTGHHSYTHVTCKNGLCSENYKVNVRYEDARTGARHSLANLSVDALRPEKTTPGQPRVPPSSG